MKKLQFEEWFRGQFFSVVGQVKGEQHAEQLWSDAEEFRRRRRLLDATVQEGRFVGKISSEKPLRVELVVPTLDEKGFTELLSDLTKTSRVSAYLFAGLLPWDEECFQWLLAPAGYLPREDGQTQPLAYTVYSTALFQELGSRLESDPFIVFQLRGMGKEEILDRLRSIRLKDLPASPKRREATKADESWEKAPSELYSLSYSLRADELPASILKRVESFPFSTADSDAIEKVLLELYAHIAKRAQAYGLTFRK